MNKRPTKIAHPRCSMKCKQHALPRRGFRSPSLACMRLLISTGTLVVISLCCLFVAQPAIAATWPVPTSELSTTLGFHQTYSAGAKSYVHSGIDIPASAGMQISSPLAGTVRFTGAVPSGDSRTGGASSQETMNAVSIEAPDGRVITLMPFASIQVSRGQAVPEGAIMGTLAASGDASTSAAHLHLGYKEGSSYLDPMQLFGSSSGSTSQAAVDSAPASSSADASLPASEPVASEVDVVDLLATGVAPASSSVAAEVPDAVSAPSSDAFGVIETGAYVLEEHASHAESPLAPIEQALAGLGAACYGQLVDLSSALSVLSKGSGIPLPVLVVGAWALSLAALTLVFIACHRFLLPRVRKIWKTQKRCLFGVPGGDSIHKLFPASGAAFMSRSRIARGR